MQVLFHYAPTRIFDFDDAIMHSPARPHSDHTSHYRLFRRTAKKMDVMIAGNPTLADYARRYCKEVLVLPTGLDTTAYLKLKAANKDGKIRFVWIGSKSTVKYLSQLRPVFEQIGKTHSNVVLRIIADEFFDLNNMVVETARGPFRQRLPICWHVMLGFHRCRMTVLPVVSAALKCSSTLRPDFR